MSSPSSKGGGSPPSPPSETAKGEMADMAAIFETLPQILGIHNDMKTMQQEIESQKQSLLLLTAENEALKIERKRLHSSSSSEQSETPSEQTSSNYQSSSPGDMDTDTQSSDTQSSSGSSLPPNQEKWMQQSSRQNKKKHKADIEAENTTSNTTPQQQNQQNPRQNPQHSIPPNQPKPQKPLLATPTNPTYYSTNNHQNYRNPQTQPQQVKTTIDPLILEGLPEALIKNQIKLKNALQGHAITKIITTTRGKTLVFPKTQTDKEALLKKSPIANTTFTPISTNTTTNQNLYIIIERVNPEITDTEITTETGLETKRIIAAFNNQPTWKRKQSNKGLLCD